MVLRAVSMLGHSFSVQPTLICRTGWNAVLNGWTSHFTYCVQQQASSKYTGYLPRQNQAFAAEPIKNLLHTNRNGIESVESHPYNQQMVQVSQAANPTSPDVFAKK